VKIGAGDLLEEQLEEAEDFIRYKYNSNYNIYIDNMIPPVCSSAL
jgi:hypothetical protein